MSKAENNARDFFGLTPTKPSAKKIENPLPEDFDRFVVLEMLRTALPGADEQAVRRIYARILKEVADYGISYTRDETQAAVNECVAEHKRLNYSKAESWFIARKMRGMFPTRDEVMRHIPLSDRRLDFVGYKDSWACYDLTKLEPKCDALLVVRQGDAAVINRLDFNHIILRKSRSKDSDWRLSYHWRYHGRSGRTDLEVPLEKIVPLYRIVGKKTAEFSEAELTAKEDRKGARAVRNPVTFDDKTEGQSGLGKVSGIFDGELISPPPLPAVGIAFGGTRRPAGSDRAGLGTAPDTRLTACDVSLKDEGEGIIRRRRN